MAEIFLSFGYDDERPYGSWADTPAGRELRKKNLDLVTRLTKTLDSEHMPRTFFLLGHYVERCIDDFSADTLRGIYNVDNPLNDLQQHTYSHQVFRKIPFSPDRRIITPVEFIADVKRANQVLGDILSITPKGLRTPVGYSQDLSDMPEILQGLDALRFCYVSSDLQGRGVFEAAFTADRQPHAYDNAGHPDLVEIPCHGFQDSVFTMEQATKLLNRDKPHNAEEIFVHYAEVFDKAQKMASETGNAVYVSLCMHPWAVAEYDPELKIHRRLIEDARNRGMSIISYSDVADRILSSK
jgi:peptidoglycan/xylan/chitin deacetylase (PgdA/CDA1 family)